MRLAASVGRAPTLNAVDLEDATPGCVHMWLANHYAISMWRGRPRGRARGRPRAPPEPRVTSVVCASVASTLGYAFMMPARLLRRLRARVGSSLVMVGG